MFLDYPELKGSGKKRRRNEVPEGSAAVCLIHATDGHKKISTIVSPNCQTSEELWSKMRSGTLMELSACLSQIGSPDVARFASGISSVMRLGITNLEKKSSQSGR